jgi:cation diffusion facilitator family transporter
MPRAGNYRLFERNEWRQGATMQTSSEETGLKQSIWAAAFMALIGIGFYFPTGSQAILLDGLFSLVGFGVCILTVKVAQLVKQPDDEHFQFGYGLFEPMLNLGKGLMIAGVCIFAAIPAGEAMFSGGRPMKSGPAIIYAVIAAAGCFGMWALQRKRARDTGSPLLQVDVSQWLMDGAISSVVAVAFVAGSILQRGALADWVDYLDPLLVLVLVVVSIKLPLTIIRTNLREVLLAVPAPETQAQLTRVVQQTLDKEQVVDYRFRTVKTGRSHMLLLHILVGDPSDVWTPARCDALRQKLNDAIPAGFKPFSFDVVFTHDKRWMA